MTLSHLLEALKYIFVFCWGYGSCIFVNRLSSRGAPMQEKKGFTRKSLMAIRLSWRDLALILVSVLLIVEGVIGEIHHDKDHRCSIVLTKRSEAARDVINANTEIVKVFAAALLPNPNEQQIKKDLSTAVSDYTKAVKVQGLVLKNYPIIGVCS